MIVNVMMIILMMIILMIIIMILIMIMMIVTCSCPVPFACRELPTLAAGGLGRMIILYGIRIISYVQIYIILYDILYVHILCAILLLFVPPSRQAAPAVEQITRV